MLQSEEKSRPFSADQVSNRRSVCSKSAGDLNLSGACLQTAARANLSRSADWPTSSAACIRKRTVSIKSAQYFSSCLQCASQHSLIWSMFTPPDSPGLSTSSRCSILAPQTMCRIQLLRLLLNDLTNSPFTLQVVFDDAGRGQWI